MCPIWFLNVGVKLLPFIMLNVETESTKINILSSQLFIFPCVSTDYMLVLSNLPNPYSHGVTIKKLLKKKRYNYISSTNPSFVNFGAPNTWHLAFIWNYLDKQVNQHHMANNHFYIHIIFIAYLFFMCT